MPPQIVTIKPRPRKDWGRSVDGAATEKNREMEDQTARIGANTVACHPVRRLPLSSPPAVAGGNSDSFLHLSRARKRFATVAPYELVTPRGMNIELSLDVALISAKSRCGPST